MNNLNDRVAELKSEAVAILDSFFEIPEGHSNGKTNRLVDCLVSAALLETASVMRQAQDKEDNYDRIFGISAAEKPEVIAAQKDRNSLLRARVDAMPIGEDLRPKDPIKLVVSPSTEAINIDCTQDKEHWEGFRVEDKEDE